MEKTKRISHKQYLFGIIFSKNVKRTHVDQSILHFLNSLSKETTHKPLNVVPATNIFSSA